jgi:hypothetical protein
MPHRAGLMAEETGRNPHPPPRTRHPALGIGLPILGTSPPGPRTADPTLGIGHPTLAIRDSGPGIGHPTLAIRDSDPGIGHPTHAIGDPARGIGQPALGIDRPTLSVVQTTGHRFEDIKALSTGPPRQRSLPAPSLGAAIRSRSPTATAATRWVDGRATPAGRWSSHAGRSRGFDGRRPTRERASR